MNKWSITTWTTTNKNRNSFVRLSYKVTLKSRELGLVYVIGRKKEFSTNLEEIRYQDWEGDLSGINTNRWLAPKRRMWNHIYIHTYIRNVNLKMSRDSINHNLHESFKHKAYSFLERNGSMVHGRRTSVIFLLAAEVERLWGTIKSPKKMHVGIEPKTLAVRWDFTILVFRDFYFYCKLYSALL